MPKALLPPPQITLPISQLPKKIIQLSSLPSTICFLPQDKLPPTRYFSKSHCFPLGIVPAELHIIIPRITFKASGTKRNFFLNRVKSSAKAAPWEKCRNPQTFPFSLGSIYCCRRRLHTAEAPALLRLPPRTV